MANADDRLGTRLYFETLLYNKIGTLEESSWVQEVKKFR